MHAILLRDFQLPLCSGDKQTEQKCSFLLCWLYHKTEALDDVNAYPRYLKKINEGTNVH